MKVFITTQALTKGVQVAIGDVQGDVFHGQVQSKGYDKKKYYSKGDWFHTWEMALEDAEKRKEKRLADLEVNKTRLQNLTFKKPE